ncbi:MAG: FtsH protease activity modulator HflK [Methylococcaceae bacterium]|nr:FtsH protease activity modulator HflK [Methylococcaceae bacterium]
MYGKKQNKQAQDADGTDARMTAIACFIKNNFQNLQERYQALTAQIGTKTALGYSGAALLLAWAASGIYIIDEGNRGVIKRFGAYQETTSPGPHWHLPFPIESASVVNVANQRFIEVGYSSASERGAGSILGESLMLTEDENIVDIKLAVQYQIKDARNYLFKLEDQLASLKQATQSAERAVIGKSRMDYVLTEGRSAIVAQIQEQIQKIMDSYDSGIIVTSVNLQDAQPPEQVQAAFEDAIKAREDKQRLINEAEAYANEIVPSARGGAARKIQEAQAYKENVIATATGDISRFNQLFDEYKKSPAVTRKRLLIETMESVLGDSNVVLLDSPQSNNMMYLPIDKMLGERSKNVDNTVSNSKPATINNKVDQIEPKFKRIERGRN